MMYFLQKTILLIIWSINHRFIKINTILMFFLPVLLKLKNLNNSNNLNPLNKNNNNNLKDNNLMMILVRITMTIIKVLKILSTSHHYQEYPHLIKFN